MAINVLLTGAGAPGGPGIIKALKIMPDMELWVADADQNASGAGLLPDHFLQIPKATDNNFISSILNICEQKKINVVLPLVTRELIKFAESASEFLSKGIHVVVSEKSALEIANNKGFLLDHLKENGIPVPAYEKVTNWNEMEQAFQKLGHPGLPVCVKPSSANGSRGFRIIDAKHDPYLAFFNDKPGNTFSSPEMLEKVFSGRSFPEMLVMEYLPGEEYTVDCLIYENDPFLILPRLRIAMNSGITVKGQFVNHPEIIAYCKKILQCLSLNGPVGIQVKADSKGQFKILEINPRLQGTSVSAMGLGINLPALSVYTALSCDEKLRISPIHWGLRFARYYDEIYFPD